MEQGVVPNLTAEVLTEAAAGLGYRSQIQLITEIAAEIAAEIAGGTELKARVKIRQLEELKVFDSLRLSIVVAAEVLVEIAAEILIEITAEILAEVKASLVVYCLDSSVN